MNKEAVIEYFDRMAPGWDSHMKRNERAITRILDNAHVKEGVKVLDVACGTGVLIPDYLNRNVISVTGIDISPVMAEIAGKKFDYMSEAVALIVNKQIDELLGICSEGGEMRDLI